MYGVCRSKRRRRYVRHDCLAAFPSSNDELMSEMAERAGLVWDRRMVYEQSLISAWPSRLEVRGGLPGK